MSVYFPSDIIFCKKNKKNRKNYEAQKDELFQK